MRQQLHKWRPVGPDNVVVMDADQPFVGEHSPKILLDGATPHGISQRGFSLVGGKEYAGRIFLRGTPGTKVSVSLSWGSDASDKQTTSFTLTRDYKRFPLSFSPKADSADASLEIAGTGSGDFHIGAVSLMPADNVQGFRPDTIALLKQLHSGMWRLPGGNFLSDWDWHDAIGDIDKRRPMFDYAWNAMQVNDVGMDEFMTLCKLIDVDPYVTVNAGLGDAHSAAEEVEYLNGAASTYWGAKRAKNGHPEPYHIKYWNIGNEPWGTFQIGYTDLKYFVIKNNDFAREMRKADPTITLIGSAKMMEPMWLKGTDRAKYVDNHRTDVRIGHRLDRRPAGEMLGNIRWHCAALVRGAGPALRSCEGQGSAARRTRNRRRHDLRADYSRVRTARRRRDPAARRRMAGISEAVSEDGRQEDLSLDG